MSRLKLLSPYVSDFAALVVLGLSVAAVIGIASMNGEQHQASLYESVMTNNL